MGDTLTVIVLATLVIMVAILGYVIGMVQRRRREADAYIRQLQEHEWRIRINSALIHALAEDYDPPPSTRRPRKLPDGWAVHKGGRLGALMLLAAGGAHVARRHWQVTAGALGAAGATTAVVTVLLTQSAPLVLDNAGPGSSPRAGLTPTWTLAPSPSAAPSAPQTPSASPTPSPSAPGPGDTPLQSPTASGPPSRPGRGHPTPPGHTRTPKPHPTPQRPTPTPTPTTVCLVDLDALAVISVCL